MAIVRTRTLALFVVAALALVAALAVALLNARAQARTELEENFSARAKIAAAVIDSTLQATAQTQGDQDRAALSAPQIDPARLRRIATLVPGQTKIVTDDRGRVLAAVPAGAAAVGSDARDRGPHVRSALDGRTSVATVRRGGQERLELAFAIDTAYGRRVSIAGFPQPLIDAFLGSYLRRIRQAGADEAYVVDPGGTVITGAGSPSGALPGVNPASEHGQVQRDDGDYVYASSAVPSSDLRVVLLKSESDLFAPIGGLGAWLIWVLFVGFTAMVGVALVLMSRLARRARELSDANDTLALRNAEVERADRAKTDFLATMSHELRTPLNGIIGFAELMHDGRVGDVSERHREYLGDILTSAHHLRRLIDDVLDLSKIEAGMLDIRPEPVDVGQLVSEVTEALRSLAVSKDLELVADVDAELDGVITDPGHLKQVLYNFLSNALKFTDPGGHITVRAQAEGTGSFRLAVTDDGPGIGPQDRDRLWSAFQQLHGRRYDGTGLGLALVKRIVEAQGGTVGVDTAPGAGSTFYAVLPRTARRASPALPALSDA
ncbi:MAG: sensor histidine kinase [Thermoleophilia bacterium]